MASLQSPIKWFGGKERLVKKILPFIPEHKTYVEVFGGGASLLFAKKPSPVEVYNDIDSELVNFFRVLRDPFKFRRFYKLVCLTSFSREEFYNSFDMWKNHSDDVIRAYCWYVVARMCFSGEFKKSWGFSVNESRRNMSSAVARWLSIIDLLPEIHARLMKIQIEHDNFRKIFKRYDTFETFFYLDPPYIPATRKSGKYRYEMSEQDYKELVNILLNTKSKVMLSGYKHEIYRPLEETGWERIDFEVSCSAKKDRKYMD